MAAGDAVLLDLDGTLTDPLTGIGASIVHAFREMGREPPAEAELPAWIGPPIRHSFARHLGSAEEAERAVALYRERFSTVGLFENRVYDGIPEALAEMREAGLRLFIATSKVHVYARRIVEHFRLALWLDGVFGDEFDGARSDKQQVVAHAMATHGLDPARTVMVGDRMHDVVGARRNGIRVIGVAWGYGSAAEFATDPPDLMVSAVEELPGAVVRMLASSP